ncbi:MAG: NAD+ synthase [Ignavibacteriae bacterium]|nr:NAD+ synthase [Ignavibacteria bacterium]MBI3364521.1 NAD+ synthase [Ignavibacteriota bacterium]
METSGKGQNPVKLNSDVVRQVLVRFIHDEITKAGFSKAVIGLSGGVDSSLVACLTSEALGAANLLGVFMPYKTSSSESLTDGRLVADQLGIQTETVDISPVVDAYIERSNGEMNNVRKGNIMARQRMIVLYDLSARENALVIGTSNKTETMLGYGTQFGDVACAINPIGDLYKTQVWQLAEAVGVPKKIIEKKPTADLWVGQTDEDELGFAYRLVDQLLYYMVDERRTEGELIERGFEKHFIDKVQRMIQRNQFKRRPPIVAKISHRTVNVDFRYPRDWGV